MELQVIVLNEINQIQTSITHFLSYVKSYNNNKKRQPESNLVTTGKDIESWEKEEGKGR
jgi:hypothetical protein